MKSVLHSDFLPQTLLPAVLVLGSREQAGLCAQALRSVAAASGNSFLVARAGSEGGRKGNWEPKNSRAALSLPWGQLQTPTA